MRTPEEEARFQQLGTQLGFFTPPAPVAQEQPGILSFAGQTAANVLPGALEKTIQPAQVLLGGGSSAPLSEVPRFFDTPAPQGIAQHGVSILGQLAEYAPSMIGGEALGARALGALGASATAARIGGGALGFALPSAPEGPESAAVQGGVGALQTAAREFGWKGKIGAGLLAGAAGYYEGQKQSPEAGLIQGGINLLAPTVIDPIVDRMLGANHAAEAVDKQGEANRPPLPNQPTAPIPFDPNVSAPAPQVAPLQLQSATVPQSPGIPFYNTPPPSGLRVVSPDGGLTDIGGGRPISGQPVPGSQGLSMPTPIQSPEFGPLGTGADFTYGRQLNPPDVFSNVPRPPILSQGETFPQGQPTAPQGFFRTSEGDIRPTKSPGFAGLTPNLDTGVTLQRNGNFYGSGTDPYDIFANVQQRPIESALTSREQSIKDSMPKTESTPLPSASRVVAPEGSGIPQPTQEGAHVIASAVKQGKKILVGSRRNSPHEEIGIQHGLTDGTNSVPEEQRGFLVQNSDGTQGFANRKRAATIAKKAGQIEKDGPEFLKSESPWTGPTEAKQNLAQPPVIEAGVKAGDARVHWNEQGMPLDVMVNKVEDGVVHYTENDFTTGQVSEKVANLQEFENLEKHPSERPVQTIKQDAAAPPVEPPAPPTAPAVKKKVQGQEDVSSLVRIKGRFGMETAHIIGREGDTLHVEVKDPIFGVRHTSVLRQDALPVETEAPPVTKGEVPFQDIESGKLRGNEGARGSAQRGEDQADLLGAILEEPARTIKTLPGASKQTLSLEEGLKLLPPEAASIIGEIIHRVSRAAGQSLDVVMLRYMPGMKGGMFDLSGRIGLNLQWVNQVVRNWSRMSEEVQGKTMMRVLALMGHETTHVAQKFAERSNLQIDGQPILKVVMAKVDSLTAEQRLYVAEQINKVKGDVSEGSLKYLSGDVQYVHDFYKRFRPNITMDDAKELAAGEFMAEVGAVELIKRMQVQGLPNSLRSAIDRFKQVLVNVVDWFRGQNQHGGAEALAGLQDIAGKMYDHFGVVDKTALHAAYPSSAEWSVPPEINPYSSVKTAPPIQPSEALKPFLTKELIRLGVRGVVGGVAGGVVGPALTDHRMSTAEGVIAGGILAAFGPALVKTLMKGQVAEELIAAAKAMKGGPLASLQVLMGGKSLRELGAEARYGLRGDGSAFAKAVRIVESEFNLNFDPKQKAIWEQARGIMGEQIAIIEDSLKKSRWSKPSQGVLDATTEYIEGRIDKDQYRALLPDGAAKSYGEFMVTAREATSVLTDNLALGMRKSAFRDAIIDARNKYVGRFYKAYRDGEFDMKYFDKVKEDFVKLNPEVSLQNADAILREHMVEVKANRKMFSDKRGTGAQAIDSLVRFRRRATEEEIYTQQLEVGSLEHNPHSAEYKAAKDKLDWMETHKVTDNWRGWLGEIKDPTERMLYTFQKVYPSSIASKIYDLLDNSMNSFGNKFAYSGSELTNTRALLKSEIAKGGPEVASLQTRLKELDAYSSLPEGANYGKLSGKFVDRFTRDGIATYDTPYKWMDQPVMRGIAAINSVVKINRTVLNPATTIRNYMQMPLFMLISRTSPQEIWQAARIIHKGANPELLSIMRQRHVLGVDYAAQELTKNLGHISSGYFDSDAAVRIAREGYTKMREIYQQPDMLVRAGAFISAQKRMAERMKLDPMHPSVIDAAVENMDRMTMNYATVPRIVKAARQLPFVSLFVSYASEMTKIIKNLSSDAISASTHPQDRMHAIGVLGAMAAVPPMLVAAFESNLSDKDRKDWQQLRDLQPDYARSRFQLPLSRDPDGKFRYMDITSMIPADSYTQMMKAALQGDMKAAIAANPAFSLQDTPLLNMATEQISGQDLHTGQPVEGVSRLTEIMKEILPPLIPPGYEGEKFINAFSANNKGTLGLTNVRTGVETRPSDIIASYLTGMRFANTNLASVQRSAVSAAQKDIAHEQQLLRDTVNMDVSAEDKRVANNRYAESVKEIMLQLNSKMQPKN